MKNEFAVKVRQLKDWLPGVKKAPEYSQNAQKRKVADVRQASEELKNRLDSLSFRDPTGKIEKTDLDRYAMIVKVLAGQMDTAPASALDTRSMDRKMIDLADRLERAVRKGRSNTARYIVQALLYGIGKGHEPLLSGEEKNSEKILAGREERLDKYIMLVEIAESIDDREHSVEKMTEAIKKEAPKANQVIRDIRREKELYPDRVEEIYASGGDMEKIVRLEVLELARKFREADNFYRQVESAKRKLEMTRLEMNQMRDALKEAEEQLMVMHEDISQTLKERLEEMADESLKSLVRQGETIGQIQDTIDRFVHAVEEVFSSDKIKNFAASALDDFEKIEREIDQQIKEDQEAEKRRQAIEQEMANKQDQGNARASLLND